MFYKNLCRIKSSGNMVKDPFYGSPSLVISISSKAKGITSILQKKKRIFEIRKKYLEKIEHL